MKVNENGQADKYHYKNVMMLGSKASRKKHMHHVFVLSSHEKRMTVFFLKAYVHP